MPTTRTRTFDKSRTILYQGSTRLFVECLNGLSPNGSAITWGGPIGPAPSAPNGGLVSVGPIMDISTISDETPLFVRTGEVLHTKCVVSEPELTTRINNTITRRTGRTDLDVPKADFVYRTYTDYNPWLSLRSLYRNSGSWIIENQAISLPALPVDRTTLDRELVRKVMSGLSQLAAANSLWEARELPTLFKMFNARSSLLKLLTTSGTRKTLVQIATSVGAVIYQGNWRHLVKGAVPFVKSVFKDLQIRSAKTLGIVSNSYALTKRELKEVRRRLGYILDAGREGQLTWSFGIMPTINDINKINRELTKGLQAFPARGRTFSARKSSTSQQIRVSSAIGSVRECSAIRMVKNLEIRSCRVKMLRPQGVSDAYWELQKKATAALGPSQLGNAWAMVPFSFMLDWVLGSDDFLDALFLRTTDQFSFDWSWSCKDSIEIEADGYYWSAVKPRTRMSDVGLDGSDRARFVFKPVQTRERSQRYYRVPTASPGLVKMLGPSQPSIKKVYLSVLIALGLRR